MLFWYWLIFISLFIFAFFEQCGRISKKVACKICFFYSFVWIFLSSIRWDGTLGDWQGYYDVFDKYLSINSFSELFDIQYWFFEPLFYMILRVIKYTTNNYSVLLFFMACVGIGGFYVASEYLNEKKIINNKIYGIENSTIITVFLIIWCTACGNIYTVRTNMATAICLISIRTIEEKRRKKFIVIVSIATLIHFTAIVFLVAYPVYHMRLNLKKISTGVLVLIFIKLIGVDKLLEMVGLLGGRYAEKLNSVAYSNTGIVDYGYLNISGFLITVKAMSNTILILLVILILRKYIHNNARFDGLVNLYIVGAAIQGLLLTYNMQLARVAIFFIIIQCFILPYAFYICRSKLQSKVIIFLGLSAYMGVKLFALINSAEGYGMFNTIFTSR